MFERFSDRARRLVVLAQEEARLLDHAWVGSEHLLLAVTALPGCDAALVLGRAGVDLGALRHDVVLALPDGPGRSPSSIPFTPEAKQVLEAALRVALRLGHQSLGSGHVLVGLLDHSGVAQAVVASLGLDAAAVEAAVAIRWAEPGSERQAGDPDEPSVRRATVQGRPVVLGGARPVAAGDCALCGRRSVEVGRLARTGAGVVCAACVTAAARALEAEPDGVEVDVPVLVTGTGPDDPGAAAAELVARFATWSERGRAPEERLAVVDGGAELVAAVRALDQRWEGRVPPAELRLTWIGFDGPDRAGLRYAVRLAERTVLVGEGGGLRRDGAWWLDRSTVEHVLELGGVVPPGEPRGSGP